MLLGVPISMDVAIVLHSLRAGGIMGITPVRSNHSALSFVVEPVNLGVKSVTNKSDLLHKYAMLDLPGTSLDMTSHTNGISQARLLNFNILKGIYMGNMKEAEANVWMIIFNKKNYIQIFTGS
jgi:hypothetical protein